VTATDTREGAGAAAAAPASGVPELAASSRGLRKTFRGTVAVDHLDLDVPSGCVLGMLGPNGSGKTTTIRMLLGLVRPTEGEVQLLGHPMPDGVAQALPRVGALVEGPGFHPYLSGMDNLRRVAAAEPLLPTKQITAAVTDALERVGLTDARNRRYRAYSLGMKQRLGLAAALLVPRDLVILDEPTNGLDPAGTREIRRVIAELHAAYQPCCGEMCQKIAAKNAEIREALAKSGGITPEVEQKLAEAGAIRAECQKAMLQHFIDVSRSMPPEEGKRYLAWVEDKTFPAGQGMAMPGMAAHHAHGDE